MSDPDAITTPARAMRELSPLAGVASFAFWTALLGTLVAVFFSVVCVVSLRSPGPGAHPEKLILVVCAVAVAVILPLAVVARRVAMARGREVYADDEAWIASQPFTVTGFFETAGRHRWVSAVRSSTSQGVGSNRYYRVRVTLGFAGRKPEEEELRAAIDRFGAPLSSTDVSGSDSSFTFDGRYAPVATAQRVLRELIPAVHGRHPLRAVRFETEKT